MKQDSNSRILNKSWASDVALTGRIPDFIGNWSKLSALRLQGNSFEGPIPSTFANLTSLTELRLGELSNASSSLAFLENMKSLTILVLRNTNISDSIPSNIGEFQNLTLLDLSFNNLNGQIPDSLFNLSLLSILFLGNNSLNGSLPQQKISSLVNIDVSYNNLQGNLPSWISQTNLQRNLIGNNFTIDSSNSRGNPIYSSFAINCGGPQFTSTDRTLYEWDNATLGPASDYVANSNRWAVSNVGFFTGNNNPAYTRFSSSQFTNTLNLELFQTGRLSASSLRYYGLGLQNGNYTVILQFSETAFENPPNWKVLAGVFLIFISRETVFLRILIYGRRQAGCFSKLSKLNSRLSWYPKTSLKSISFGREKELAVYLPKVLFQPSALPMNSHLQSVRRIEQDLLLESL